MKKFVALFMLLSLPLHAQSFWGIGGSAIFQKTLSYGVFGQCSGTALGGLIGIEFEGIDREPQYPVYTMYNTSFQGAPTVPDGWEYILSGSYCYQLSSNFFAGAIIGVALRQEEYFYQKPAGYSPDPTGVYVNGSGTNPSAFVPNFGVAIKLLPLTLEYSTEGGFGLGFEARI